MKFEKNKTIKRLAIYFFYDKDGVVDDYIPYMIEDLNKNITELLVVCNGKLNKEGREKFLKLTPNLMVRENVGFDVWAYKEGMEYYGWDKLAEFDEVILMNFTIMGPLYPFKEMFDEMDTRDVDFWGITKHHGFHFDPFGTIKYGYIPEHIQSSFISVRNNILTSYEFQKYWDNMGEVNSYGEAIGKHEAIFTKYFQDIGFVSDVYIQTDDLKKLTHYPLMIMSCELVQNRRCPIIKRKCFTNEYYEFLNATIGEPTIELYEFIKNNTDYPVDFIWDNLLRVDNMADIKLRMHLNYILPVDISINSKLEQKKVALILHIYFEDLIEYCFNYACSMPEYADIYITTDTKEKKEEILTCFQKLECNKLEVIIIENRGRDISSLLVASKDFVMNYDYVCFAHDKKTTQFEPYTIGKSFSYKCFENILSSKKFVNNILYTFENNKRLGMLMPPPPNHAGFFCTMACEWGSNYNNTLSLANKLKLRVNMDEHKEPISPLGTMFWFRPEAMRVLFDYNWKYEDFPEEPNGFDGTILHAVERIYGFVIQHHRYYPAWIMSDKFSRIELTNTNFMLRELTMSEYSVGNVNNNFSMFKYAVSCRNNSIGNILKMKIKTITPEPIYNFLKKIYHFFK